MPGVGGPGDLPGALHPGAMPAPAPVRAGGTGAHVPTVRGRVRHDGSGMLPGHDRHLDGSVLPEHSRLGHGDRLLHAAGHGGPPRQRPHAAVLRARSELLRRRDGLGTGRVIVLHHLRHDLLRPGRDRHASLLCRQCTGDKLVGLDVMVLHGYRVLGLLWCHLLPAGAGVGNAHGLLWRRVTDVLRHCRPGDRRERLVGRHDGGPVLRLVDGLPAPAALHRHVVLRRLVVGALALTRTCGAVLPPDGDVRGAAVRWGRHAGKGRGLPCVNGGAPAYGTTVTSTKWSTSGNGS
jgi:hypothetical protein